jgi:hypothetical protein
MYFIGTSWSGIALKTNGEPANRQATRTLEPANRQAPRTLGLETAAVLFQTLSI